MKVIFDREVEVFKDGDQGIAGRADSGKGKSHIKDYSSSSVRSALGRTWRRGGWIQAWRLGQVKLQMEQEAELVNS